MLMPEYKSSFPSVQKVKSSPIQFSTKRLNTLTNYTEYELFAEKKKTHGDFTHEN